MARAAEGKAHPPTWRYFSQVLMVFGIQHTAAEYEGTHGSRTMGPPGRMYQQVLPFFNKHLDFAN